MRSFTRHVRYQSKAGTTPIAARVVANTTEETSSAWFLYLVQSTTVTTAPGIADSKMTTARGTPSMPRSQTMSSPRPRPTPILMNPAPRVSPILVRRNPAMVDPRTRSISGTAA